MKKLTLKQKLHNIKNSRKGYAKKHPKAYKKISIYNTYNAVKKEFEKVNFNFKKKERRIEVISPERIALSDNYEEVIEFFKFIRKYSTHPETVFYIDFTSIKCISPLCALLLTSEIHNWDLSKKSSIRVVDSDMWDDNVKRLFYEMGLFSLINMTNSFEISEVDSPVKYVQFRSGTQNKGELADTLTKQLKNISGALGQELLLYRGLTEAMQNAIDWAYPFEAYGSVLPKFKRWWMSGSYNIEKGRVTIMLYDHGIGIPKTLPKSKNFWNNILKILPKAFGECKDSELIKAAMEVGRSASGSSHRGKGLGNIQEFIKSSDKGLLRVISGKGEYMIDQDMNEKIIEHKNSLNGTLIAWEIYQENKND